MQNLTFFFALICISQVIFANPINETLTASNNDKKSEKDMMETAGNNVVFRPLFVYRQQQAARRRAREHRQRSRRDANSVNEKIIETNNEKTPEKETMETAANNVVFRPLFVYRQQQEARRRARQHRQRCRRHATTPTELLDDNEPLPVLPLSTTTTSKIIPSTEKVVTTTVNPEITTPKSDRKSKKAHDGSDLDHHESGLVFRPLFVYRQQQAARRRIAAERRNQADRRYYESVPTYNYYPTYKPPYYKPYKPTKKDCHDPNKELYI
ncbi:uncharacterized protein LOC123301844 [Chrysoperla carnea]|uniref:uncharacterized protein LOC123301844 n=1 Tax=Chrysoperla carnea TaxID=189513 RepID=UPI001D079693|nr:uncharacterized protein LOC123301844 [Chrysoperla carnea]